MARPVSLDYDQIKRDIEAKGVTGVEVKRDEQRLQIYFKCRSCGADYKMPYAQYLKGQNSGFYCKDCQVLNGPRMQRVREYFDFKGVEITKVDLSDRKHLRIHWNCVRCGRDVEIIDDYVGKNNKELCCKYCRDNTRVPTQGTVEQFFISKGSKLLSEYKGYHLPLTVACSKCGGEFKVALSKIRSGYNPNVLCKYCSGNSSERELIDMLTEKGSELLGEYVNQTESVMVRCSRCGDPFKFNYATYKAGRNQDVLCRNCQLDLTGRDPSKISNAGRTYLDNYWLKFLKEFYNIPREDFKKYNAHHIIRYIADKDRQTSFANGYPLDAELHKKGRNYYHSGDGRFIENWGDAEKLPYHNYEDFKFLDLNSKCITEVLYPTESMPNGLLYDKKKKYAEEGILYLPFFYTEMINPTQRELVYSMIRARLYKWFPQIYEYTGTKLTKYYGRKLEIVEIGRVQADPFFSMSHIQGKVNASIYVGLVDEQGNLVCCMAFSRPRQKSQETYSYELLRFASKPNSVVIGGASKIFKYFVNKYSPESVISFCDLRFSAFDPNDSIYAKLGFDYIGYSQPNYNYRDPNFDITKNRRTFQKHMLKDKLEIYDPKLSEYQNMEMNGYTRQVDCGNYKFVWYKK